MSSGYPVSSIQSAAGQEPELSGAEESVIDRGSAFDGVLRSSRNVRIEGQAKGEIHCEGTVFIDEGADVDARIVAANVMAAGRLQGDLTCHGRLQILPTGRVTGKVATSTLVIQEGAVYEGELRMTNVGSSDTAASEEMPTVQVTSLDSAAPSTTPPTAGAPAAFRAQANRRGTRDARRDDEGRGEGAPVAGETPRRPDHSTT